MEQQPQQQYIKIKDINPNLQGKNLWIKAAIVLENKTEKVIEKDGEHHFLIADETACGSILVQQNVALALHPSDILKIQCNVHCIEALHNRLFIRPIKIERIGE